MSFKVRIAIAAVCAVLAAVCMAAYAASVRGEAEAQREGALARYGGEVASVYVATRDIARGETFTERNVALADWLVDLLPEGAVTDGSQVLGKVACAALARNAVVSTASIEVMGDPLDVPAGLVALSIPCSNETAVGGALGAGSLADLYVVHDGSARLLASQIQVLHTNAEGSAANLSWATVAVAPEEVEAIVAAASIQKIHFVVPSDEEVERRELAQDVDEPTVAPDAGMLPEGATGGVGPVDDGGGGGEVPQDLSADQSEEAAWGQQADVEQVDVLEEG